MWRRVNPWWVLGTILCLPLFNMLVYPLADTTEPRYAEIARLMAETGDWITPWFEAGVPFWGKPPLSFWSEALSFRLFGVNEFAARLPSWLATLGSVALIIGCTRAYFSVRTAQLAAIIYGSCALVYISAGAVLTDPFLALGTTWAMTGLIMAVKKPTWFWRYSFFIGLSIGLLAKGPLVLLLVAGAAIPWLLLHKSARTTCVALPWARGLLLTAVLSVPWYIAAELKTPGFLNYFIVGEHFLRFVDSGWKGDLYGKAHSRPYGTIWYHWVQASFPWGLLALGMIIRALLNPVRRVALSRTLHNPEVTYLLGWALFTPAFFTLSGNILWTYLLPALPAFSILLAIALQSGTAGNQTSAEPQKAGWSRAAARAVPWLAFVTPLAATVFTVIMTLQPMRVKTEQGLVHYAQKHMQNHEQLVFVNERPFSARFYSKGTAGFVPLNRLEKTLAAEHGGFYLAVPKGLLDTVTASLPSPINKKYEDRRFVLFVVPPAVRIASANGSLPAPSPLHPTP